MKAKMQIHNVQQGSKEWFDLRVKYPLTASEAQSIGNQGKGLETLCWEKVAEKYSSADKERFSNEHTERGKELESQGRKLYELETGNKVVEVGFITDEDISKVGGVSPDGLIGENGLFEEKCFDDVKHFKMIVEPTIESKYMWQMQMQMLFTGRKWCDFVSYNPNFKQNLVIVRVNRDPKYHLDILEGLVIGEKLIKEIEAKIK